MTCRRCQGRGWIPATVAIPAHMADERHHEGDYVDIDDRCPDCDGTGVR